MVYGGLVSFVDMSMQSKRWEMGDKCKQAVALSETERERVIGHTILLPYHLQMENIRGLQTNHRRH